MIQTACAFHTNLWNNCCVSEISCCEHQGHPKNIIDKTNMNFFYILRNAFVRRCKFCTIWTSVRRNSLFEKKNILRASETERERENERRCTKINGLLKTNCSQCILFLMRWNRMIAQNGTHVRQTYRLKKIKRRRRREQISLWICSQKNTRNWVKLWQFWIWIYAKCHRDRHTRATFQSSELNHI